MSIKITKMHGCGNDFIILDYKEFKKTGLEMNEVAKQFCDRHYGFGADGLIIPNTDTEDADIGWFFYNADGSIAQMCGNGMRCFAKYVYDNNLVNKNKFTVKTVAGIITPEITDDGKICINMSKPILNPEEIPFIPNNNFNYKIAIKDKIFEGTAISMGNPHFVIYVRNDENLLSLAKNYGSEIEQAFEFPEKTNVEFVKTLSYKEIEMCVWERGCGITLACGTGACASVVTGILNGHLHNEIKVNLSGGSVDVKWNGSKENPNCDVFLSGPAEYVYYGELA